MTYEPNKTLLKDRKR